MIEYPLKGLHVISGETEADGTPKAGAVIEVETTNGFLPQVDPKTRQALPDSRQRFMVQADGLSFLPIH